MSPMRFLGFRLIILAAFLGGAHNILPKSNKAPYELAHAILPYQGRDYSFGKARYVLIVSIDGVSYPLLKYAFNQGFYLPNLRKLVRRGFFRPMQTVLPSMTWPSHASMVTGQYPATHGILGNRWLKNRKESFYPFQVKSMVEYERKTPSLFYLTKIRGWKSAALNWPNTQGSRLPYYNFPELMHARNLNAKLVSKPLKRIIAGMYWRYFKGNRHPSRSYKQSGKTDEFLNRIALKERVEIDMMVRDMSERLIHPGKGVYWPKRKIPRLIAAHFLITDSWHHAYGTNPMATRWGLELVDSFLGRIMAAYERAGVANQTAILIGSDHGFVNSSHKLDLRVFLKRHRYLEVKRRADQVTYINNGHTAFLYFNKKSPPDVKRLVKTLRGSPAVRRCLQGIYEPAEFAKMGLPVPSETPDAPDLLLVNRPFCYFTTTVNRRTLTRLRNGSYQIGTHGYLPNHPEMLSFMIGAGSGIKKSSTRRKAYIVDLATTAAHLMGLRWPRRFKSGKQFKLDGRVLFDVLKNKKKR